MAAGTCRETSLSTVASRSSFSLAARFTAVGCRLATIAAVTGCSAAWRSTAAFCCAALIAAFVASIRADSCRTCRSYNVPARLPTASRQPRAQVAARRQVCRGIHDHCPRLAVRGLAPGIHAGLEVPQRARHDRIIASLPPRLCPPIYLSRSSCSSQLRAHSAKRPRQVCFHRALAQSRCSRNLAQLPVFDIAQQEYRPLPLAQSLDSLPNLRYLFPRQNLLLRASFAVRQPVAGFVHVHRSWTAYAARTAGAGCASGPSAN